jgi:hypothetical protein
MPLPADCYPVNEPRITTRRNRFLVLAAATTLLAGPSVAKPSQAPVCEAHRTIPDALALAAAIRCAAPYSILKLASADFGTVEIRKPQTSGLTITSADPTRPARFNGLALHETSGFTLRNLKVGGPPPSGWRYAMLVFRSNSFSAENIDLVGDRDAATAALDSAIMVRSVEGAKLRRLRIANHRNGVSLLDVRNVEVVENSLTNLRVDGIRGGGVNEARIARNVIASFRPVAGDHPDGIQLWSRNQKESAENILIEDNLILRGSGAPIQGIFIEDRINLPFRKLVIRNNLCVGTMYNGIMIMGGDGAEIKENRVIPLEPQTSWIRVETSRAVNVTGNEAGKYILNGGARSVGRNRTGPMRREADEVIRAWRNRLDLPSEDFPA